MDLEGKKGRFFFPICFLLDNVWAVVVQTLVKSVIKIHTLCWGVVSKESFKSQLAFRKSSMEHKL